MIAAPMLAPLSLTVCALLVPTPVMQSVPALPTTRIASTNVLQDRLPSAPAALFPCESTLLADDAIVSDEDNDGKSRGRLILGVIVANSIFWQYVLPIFKGQPTSTGRKKK